MSKMLVAGQSDTLTEFYRAYLAWVEAGTPKHPHFARCWGLCCNLADYYGGTTRASLSAADEMRMQFRQAGLDEELPFNPYPGSRKYTEESLAYQCHLNPHRIQWVRDHV